MLWRSFQHFLFVSRNLAPILEASSFASMEQREVEVTIISSYHLRNVKNFGGKMSPYAVAWIHPNMKERTPMDIDGGLDPKWNAKLNLVCEESFVEDGNAIITIDIYDGSSISNKTIGTASVALSQLPGGKVKYTRAASETKFLTLQVC